MTNGGWSILIGFIMIFLGALMIRVYCELIILLFRIYDSLRVSVPARGVRSD